MSAARLERLRALRETVARGRLGVARRERDAAERAHAEAVEAARACEATQDERSRARTRAILAEPATALRMARLSLDYERGREELAAARRRIEAEAEAARAGAEAAERARLDWSARARSWRKAGLLREALAEPVGE